MEEYKIYEKGDLVIKELKSLDRIYNHSIEKANGRMRRKTRTADDVIGYFVDQKAFRFKKETRNSMPVTTIWRVQ